MSDFQQGYDDHALALGRDPKKESSADYQAGWKKSKSDTRKITNHGKVIQQANAEQWHPQFQSRSRAYTRQKGQGA